MHIIDHKALTWHKSNRTLCNIRTISIVPALRSLCRVIAIRIKVCTIGANFLNLNSTRALCCARARRLPRSTASLDRSDLLDIKCFLVAVLEGRSEEREALREIDLLIPNDVGRFDAVAEAYCRAVGLGDWLWIPFALMGIGRGTSFSGAFRWPNRTIG